MNVREWKSLRKLIHKEFYTDLVDTSECGAFDGGCVVVAQALQQVIGGEIVVLVRGHDKADHAAVFQDGKLWDYDGPLSPMPFIARFNRVELWSASSKCHGYRAIREGDLPGAYRDDVLVDRLADVFRKMLPQSIHQEAISPSRAGI